MPSSDVLYLSVFVFLLLVGTRTGSEAMETFDEQNKNNHHAGTHQTLGGMGGILDHNSRVGREEKTSMALAVEDFYNSTGYKLLLYLRDSNGSSARAASAAMDLINNQRVDAIIGDIRWEEVALVAELDSGRAKAEVPIISLAAPSINPSRWTRSPFFIHMGYDISFHMKCISSIVNSYKWRNIIAIYEDTSTYTRDSGLITILSDLLQAVGSQIEYHSAFPPLYSLLDPRRVIQEELKKLKSKQCRVFVVIQSSLPLATLLFKEAKKMGMMSKSYVWITTDTITSLLDSVDSSAISSMQGLLGFKAYFSDTTESFQNFKRRFWKKFRAEYPLEEEENPDPSIFALRAYDATCAVARAMQRSWDKHTSKASQDCVLSTNFKGLSGHLSFKDGQLTGMPVFKIINVVGKSYREVGFWSPKSGFSENVIEHDSLEKMSGNESMEVLGPIYWPGGSQSVPTGWAPVFFSNETERPFKIGVPANAAFKQFVSVNYDERQNRSQVTGFSVSVFEAVVNNLPYHLHYELVPYGGSYDDMVKQIHNGIFDAAVGDIEIMADRFQYAEFTHPYVESGLVMVVRVIADKSPDPLILTKAFTGMEWFLIVAMSVFTGVVVGLYQRDCAPEVFGGPITKQIGTMLWFSATSFFSPQIALLDDFIPRVVAGVWQFVVLIIIALFTASITSRMTVSRLEPAAVDIDFLKNTNAAVGCNGNSFIVAYLISVLGFKPENIKRIASIEDYPLALSSGDIKAAFFVEPHADAFLTKYCQGYTKAGPKYTLGGFGYAFKKGSPLAFDISEAILKLIETGKMEKLQRNILHPSNCSSSRNDVTGPYSLLSGIFTITGVVSAAALFITVGRRLQLHLKLQIYTRKIYSRISDWFTSYRAHLCRIILKRWSAPKTEGNEVRRTELTDQQSNHIENNISNN